MLALLRVATTAEGIPDVTLNACNPARSTSITSNLDRNATMPQLLTLGSTPTSTTRLELCMGKDGDSAFTRRKYIEEMCRASYFQVGCMDAQVCIGIMQQLTSGMDDTSRAIVFQRLQPNLQENSSKRRAPKSDAMEVVTKPRNKTARFSQLGENSTEDEKGSTRMKLLAQTKSKTVTGVSQPTLHVSANQPRFQQPRLLYGSSGHPSNGTKYVSAGSHNNRRAQFVPPDSRFIRPPSCARPAQPTLKLHNSITPMRATKPPAILMQSKKISQTEEEIDRYAPVVPPKCPKCKKPIANGERVSYTHERNNGDSFYFNYRCCMAEFSDLRSLSGHRNKIFSRLLPPPAQLVRWVHNGRKWKLICRGRQWTRCEYCRSLYMFGRGSKGYHTKEKCPLWQEDQKRQQQKQQQ